MDFGTLPLIFSTSKYFRWKTLPRPSFYLRPNISDKLRRKRKYRKSHKSDIWPPASSKKRGGIFKESFQTLEAFSPHKGVFVTRFLRFRLIFVNSFLRFSIFWFVERASAKKNHVLDENWQRNQFSKFNIS